MKYWKIIGSKIVHKEFKHHNRRGEKITICGKLLSNTNMMRQKGIAFGFGQKKCKICFRTAKNITCG